MVALAAGGVAIAYGIASEVSDIRSTSHQRAVGHEIIDQKFAKIDWDEAISKWMKAAQSISDPDERRQAVSRLTEIVGFAKMIQGYADEGFQDSTSASALMSSLLGQTGENIEDGNMGDVFAVILSGDTSLMSVLMGQDGFLGFGDGLDGDEWKTIKDNFTKQLGELRNTLNLKPPTAADKNFNRIMAAARGEDPSPASAEDEATKRRKEAAASERA